MSTAEGGVYNVISKETVEALLSDKGALKLLSEHGYEITPLTNDAGEIIGNVIRTASSSNGATTAVSNTVNVLVKDATVDQTMLDSIASGSIGTASDIGELAIGDTVSQVTMEAGGAGVGGTALATVAGPAIAVGLGVAAGTVMYNIAPEFWTKVSDKLVAAGKTIGGKVISFFDKDGKTYYDKETIDIIQKALEEEGYLKSGTDEEYTETDTSLLYNENFPQPIKTAAQAWGANSKGLTNGRIYEGIDNESPVKAVAGIYRDDYVLGLFSKKPFTEKLSYFTGSPSNITSSNHYPTSKNYTKTGNEFYYDETHFGTDDSPVISPDSYGGVEVDLHAINEWIKDTAQIILFGNKAGSDTPSAKPLPTEDEGARTVPTGEPTDKTGDEDDKKKKVYPFPFPSSLPNPDHNDDPSSTPSDNHDPDPTPNDDDKENPKKDPNSQPEGEPQDDPAPNPDPNKPSSDPTDDKPQDPDDPNPPDPDGGDPTPGIPILPIVASAGLGNIYNPSKAQVSALQSYLWSSDHLVDILKLFQNPVDGIISLHWVFGTPVDGGSKEITLGYLPTGVSAPVVTSQFTDIDCGTITIPLKQKNALDYPPYTDIQIYLPFIGIEPLNAYDLVGGTLNVTYRIDVYTGACVAKLTAKRNGLNCKLYEFAGNCGYELPLTSGNFVGMVGNVISGAVTGALIGGVGGAVLGGARSAIHSNMDVRRSGNLSANAGICGSRIPYVIITRAVPYDAANYNMFYGYPSNKTVYLSNCKGYTKVKDIVLHTSATDEEKQEIESLLKEGVYL